MEHAVTPFKSIYGYGRLHCFSFGDHEEDNVLCLEVDGYLNSGLVRLQSACYTAEILRSTDCDCHEQLDGSLRLIHENGGLLVYVLCDGRGAGLLTKIKGLALGHSEGLDTFEAYQKLGVKPDPRRYDQVATVLQRMRLSKVRLLTNNPRKVEELQKAGFEVERVALEIAPTADSEPYLRTKRIKFGHFLRGVSKT